MSMIKELPPLSKWTKLCNQFRKRLRRKEFQLNKRFSKGKISDVEQAMLLSEWKKKNDPHQINGVTELEVRDYYGMLETEKDNQNIHLLKGNDIYSYSKVIYNMWINPFPNIIKIGKTWDNHNFKPFYEKFMEEFHKASQKIENQGKLSFIIGNKSFEDAVVREIPTAIYDRINSDLHFTPYHLNVSEKESHLMLSDMVRYFALYKDTESKSSWFNMPDILIYDIGTIKRNLDMTICYGKNNRVLWPENDMTYCDVLLTIENIFNDHFSNIDTPMDVLGVRSIGLLVTPYDLSLFSTNRDQGLFVDIQQKKYRYPYNFYLIIEKKY